MIYRFEDSKIFDDVESIELKKDDKIYLWGAGKVGTVVAHVLEQGGYNILGFVDIDSNKVGTKVYGYDVISPDEYYAKNQGTKTIVSCAFPSVITFLEGKGIKAYSPHELLLTVDFENYHGELTPEFLSRLVDNAIRNYAMFFNKGRVIERLLLVVTEKCTLKCKNCDAYMPYHHHPKQSDFEDVVKNYNTVLDVCGYIDNVDILGGEPLLYPELDRVIDYLIKDRRCGKISIISNGTLIPKDKVLAQLKNDKCVFRISDYGILSKNKDSIISVLEKENIKYEITNYQYWDEIPRIEYKDESDEQLNLKFATCTANSLYVKANIACYCTFLAGLYNIRKSNDMFPNFDSNIVYLDQGEKSKKDLKEYIANLHSRKAIEACKYCPGAHCIQFGNKVPVAEQAEGFLPIEELYKNGRIV